MAELKPCPFCGKKAISIKLEYGDGDTYYGFTCEHWNCPISSVLPNYSSEEKAIEAWNRRYTDAE
jgi:Lar family restriction alleviation protein